MKYQLLLVILLMVCSGCAINYKYKISKVEIATGHCHGECPFSATRIDSSLKIDFYGGNYAAKKGFYKGFITKKQWGDLTRLLTQVNYKALDTLYRKTFDDQELELIITANGVTKHILAQDESLPKKVALTLHNISEIYKTADLHPVRDSIVFTTKVQYLPKIAHPLFSPPVNKN